MEAETAVSSSGSLLIVDDNEANRDLLSRRLSRQGYRTTIVSSGPAALKQIAEHPYDLVLLDIDMPEMTGMDVLKEIRSRHSRIELPVIMVTALSESSDVVLALQSGANDYV